MKRRLILASKSKGRKEVLTRLGINFEVFPGTLEEELPEKIVNPVDFVLDLSKRKVKYVLENIAIDDYVVLGADTIIFFNGHLIGKPQNEKEAIEMLNQLSGEKHQVITGIHLIDVTTSKEVSKAETTLVKMRYLTEKEILDYIHTGEAIGKAGAYAVQGRGAILIESINGCFWNIVGLPVSKFVKALKSLGVQDEILYPLI